MVRWTNCRVKLRELVPWDENPRKMTKKQAQRILDSFRSFGQFQTIAIGPNNEVYDGHQRLSALRTVHGDDYELDARRADRPLTDEERRQLVIYAHISATGSWDWDKLKEWNTQVLEEWGIDDETLRIWQLDAASWSEMMSRNTDQDAEWQNMPMFEKEPVECYKSISVHFQREEDMIRFSEIIGQKITEKTRYIWFPPKEKQDLKSLGMIYEP